MFDPLLTLLAAKAKAVGLVAGTALATTALVGGGAVAMTAVSSETAVEDTAVVVEAEEGSALAEQVVAVELTPAATPTVGIEEPADDEAEGAEEDGRVRPPLPADFVCDDSKNHGQNVSAYAKSLPKGPGRGEKVSAVAQSDCGKTAGETEEAAEAQAAETETAEVEAAGAEEAEEPKPAKAEKKAAKAERKASSGKSSGKGGGKK